MLIDLKDKVTIVTGAGRGIGNEIAKTFAGEGAIVVIADVRQDLLDAVAAEWKQNGWRGLQLRCDVSSADDCWAVARATEAAFGRIDVLINNAGVATGAKVEELSEDIWDKNFDINTKGVFLMCQAVIPPMKRQKSGRIINAASFAAIVPSIGSAAYAASKAAVAHFTRVLAGELGPWDITVNSYAPGMIPTEMNHFAEAAPERQEMLLNTLSLRRWGDPRDVANLLCFLASDKASYITGALIDVSGGKLATQIPQLAYQ
jgi:3-oxoacyl-[acyl-carrier protein] reductase